MADSLIRLRQINRSEISGLILDVAIANHFSSGILSGTGNLTGAFYPLNSNPSGYIVNSGFITTGQTGNFVDDGDLAINIGNTLTTVSNLYYLNSNPSGFVTTGQTGLFLTSAQTGNYILSGLPNTTFNKITATTIVISGSGVPLTISGTSGNYQQIWKNYQGTTVHSLDDNELSLNSGVVFGNVGRVRITGGFLQKDLVFTDNFKQNITLKSLVSPTGFVRSGETGLLLYAKNNPSGFITSGLVAQSSGYLQNQIEDIRVDYAKLYSLTQDVTLDTLTFGDFTLYNVPNGFRIKDTNPIDVLLYDNPTETFIIAENFNVGEVLSVNAYIKNLGTYIDTGSVVAVDMNSRELSGSWKVQNLSMSGLPILTKTSADSLYYDIGNSNNYSTKSYVGANFAPISDYISKTSAGQNTTLRLYDSFIDETPFQFIEGIRFDLSDSGGNGVLDVYKRSLDIDTITCNTGSFDYIDVADLYLGGIPIKTAVSGTPATGGLLSLTDDNHNKRLAIYDTGSLTNRFYAGSGRNDSYYLQYYYVYPNSSTELKSSIDFANQSIQGFGITSNSITNAGTITSVGQISVNGSSVITASQTGQFYSTSNPSGFITGFNSGIYITTGQTGSFGGGGNTGALTGAFYPLKTNPSGYLTGINSGLFALSSETGAIFAGYLKQGAPLSSNTSLVLFNDGAEDYSFYCDNNVIFYLQNPSNPVTKIHFQDATINNFSGNFTTLKVSGINVSTGVSNINTGTLTGVFYPLNNNPSGYITGFNSGLYTLNVNTGNFIDRGQTGQFVTTGQTGSIGGGNTGVLTGAFYPLLTNPSGYLTGFNSGLYVLNSQTGAFYPRSGNISGFLTGFNSGDYITTGQTGQFITTGQTGNFGGGSSFNIYQNRYYV